MSIFSFIQKFYTFLPFAIPHPPQHTSTILLFLYIFFLPCNLRLSFTPCETRRMDIHPRRSMIGRPCRTLKPPSMFSASVCAIYPFSVVFAKKWEKIASSSIVPSKCRLEFHVRDIRTGVCWCCYNALGVACVSLSEMYENEKRKSKSGDLCNEKQEIRFILFGWLV